ncbi:MAG: hypothetical protein L6R38_006112 [Xanthoria sp. 2 TBL-2021]|nr:MAG: hypothetical protein L6R38_006112 [Xanthoria sp. 2 TBL-2021]
MSLSRKGRDVAATDDTESGNSELEQHLRLLSTKKSTSSDLDIVESNIAAGHGVRQLLLDHPGNKDTFRHLGGFEILLGALDSLPELCVHDGSDSESQENSSHLLSIIFSILAAALAEHRGNRRYWQKRIPQGGWKSLEVKLHAVRHSVSQRSIELSQALERHVYGCLVACAIDDETIRQLFKPTESECTASETLADELQPPTNDASATVMEVFKTKLDRNLGTGARLHYPEPLYLALKLWLDWQLEASVSSEMGDASVVQTVTHLARLNTHNLVALHRTDLLNTLLLSVFNSKGSNPQMTQLYELAALVLSLGTNKLDTAQLLFSTARSSSVAADLLLYALRSAHSPSYFHFDLSICGYSSIELPDIGTFPPTSSSSGYTISLWLQIVKFDINAHTTLFGAFDASQTCFLLLYLEKDSHNLILQTSVTSTRPSVRFKTVSFREGRWYHIALAHRRPKATSSSRVSLFVNGNFVEQVKSNYPLAPPIAKPKSGSANHTPSSHNRNSPVQAFVGTPQDLASRLGKDVISSQWRLASAYVFSDILSDDLLAVHYELGPRYYGNYQDCLGSFNTYQAASSLKIRNDSLHSGKQQHSDIIRAMEMGASELLPETRIVLGLSPWNVLSTDNLGSPEETPVPVYLSKAATETAKSLGHKGHDYLVINGSIPSFNDAFCRPHGFAVPTGGPVITLAQPFDDAAWQVGGCTGIVLDHLEKSYGDDATLRALNCVFECIRDNWRCSEAMEKDNGFAILSALISRKIDARAEELSDGRRSSLTMSAKQHEEGDNVEDQAEFTLKLLSLILKFLGFCPDKPEDSVLNNPLAYRVLIVDADYWRRMQPSVQKLYYEQFGVFGIRSKYHNFNAKRLSKMRIIKKWLDALKTDSFRTKSFGFFLTAFKSLLAMNMAADHLRSLAMYITYAIEQGQHEEPYLHNKTHHGVMRNSSIQTSNPQYDTSNVSKVDHSDIELPTSQMAIRLLELYAEILCIPGNTAHIARFTKTVTNKWLLHLLISHDDQIIIQATRILARLLVFNGQSYVTRFEEETGGMVILRHRLENKCHLPAIWRICFAVLFSCDVSSIDLGRPFSLFSLVDDFEGVSKSNMIHPEILPVIIAMVQNGLRMTCEESPALGTEQHKTNKYPITDKSEGSTQAENDSGLNSVLKTAIRFLADMHARSSGFRDFAASSKYVQELLFTLYPIVTSSSVLDADVELQSRESLIAPEEHDVLIRPLSRSFTTNAYVIRTLTAESPSKTLKSRLPALRRMSSYVLVRKDSQLSVPTSDKLRSSPALKQFSSGTNSKDQTIAHELLEIIITVYLDQILVRKDFLGLGLFMKVPPGVHEHQAFFESFMLRNTLVHLGNSIRLDQKLLWEPRVLANLQRLAGHLGEAVFEGWFIDGAEIVFDFLGGILEYIHLPEINRIKSVRLCDHITATLREVLLRVVLLRLSELDEAAQPGEAVAFMEKLVYWQTVILAAGDNQKHFLRLFCFLLYAKMVGVDDRVRMSAANLWRLLLVQKPEETSQILRRATVGQNIELSKEFSKLMELDNETFLAWVDDNRNNLDVVFFGGLSQSWGDFVAEENRNTEEAAKIRISRRKEKLKQWSSQAIRRDDTIRRHETSCDHWRSNIYASESTKKHRAVQEQQNNLSFISTTWIKLKRRLERPCGLLEGPVPLKWQLDQTEGRNRMRLRMILDPTSHLRDYQPKRKESQGPSRQRKSTFGKRRTTLTNAKSPVPSVSKPSAGTSQETQEPAESDPSISAENGEIDDGDEFELVGDPGGNGEDWEDKNRKVMRSLHRNDQVEDIHNVSRVIGLEGSEGLLILGKYHLYLLDGLFQRSDGEIVNVSQAPQDERDTYLQMISGREPGDPSSAGRKAEQEVRSWRREEVLSLSKRRFLFRDVAIELFFDDGRSYLLTTNNPDSRDGLYQKLLSKASVASGRAAAAAEEGSWRFDSVQSQTDSTQSLGSRFTSVFAQTHSNPATRRWTQGEISNFNYLMHINTMAGRTFNDLTQYPVFPWVIADYKSDELDLTDPRSFRDLTKPMGCQTPERQADFRDRYQSFAEMGDHNAPPFHYGTHYSTAMIVTSYLIRLQPFVQSYLLLQGGSFDHPDRLFYSIEKAWASASRENMTDVRELIPEFFYLPEFLLNSNEFDFGERQGDGGTIDKVALPPWAKGDPKVFIAKNREALESEYVSKNLHHWIDLVFGHKQRGEAALEATNVFHHLSYHGARDLDKIEDPVERLATIGIIHNFGQTPHQVFPRNHPSRNDAKHIAKQIDTMADSLTRLPSAVFDINDRVASLLYSTRLDRLMCSSPSKINIGPSYDKYMEWGFVDGGIRFYAGDSKKLIGLFEHVHVGQLSCVLFADSKTLITAGNDCVVSVWGVDHTSKTVEMQPTGSLFGHRTPITTLAVSASFRTLLSASEDGQVLLWDLNRLEIIRKLASGDPVTCARIHDVNGTMMICRGPNLLLYTLNGDLIIDQQVCTEDDTIMSCAFYEGSGNDYLERNLVFTGHRKGVLNIWNVTIRSGAFVLEHIKRMHHLDPAGYNIGSAITCILPLAQKVYTGDEDGRVYEWHCIQRQ